MTEDEEEKNAIADVLAGLLEWIKRLDKKIDDTADEHSARIWELERIVEDLKEEHSDGS